MVLSIHPRFEGNNRHWENMLGLGVVPPAESRDRAPSQDLRGKAPRIGGKAPRS